MSHIINRTLFHIISSTLLPIVGDVCTTSFIRLQTSQVHSFTPQYTNTIRKHHVFYHSSMITSALGPKQSSCTTRTTKGLVDAVHDQRAERRATPDHTYTHTHMHTYPHTQRYNGHFSREPQLAGCLLVLWDDRCNYFLWLHALPYVNQGITQFTNSSRWAIAIYQLSQKVLRKPVLTVQNFEMQYLVYNQSQELFEIIFTDIKFHTKKTFL